MIIQALVGAVQVPPAPRGLHGESSRAAATKGRVEKTQQQPLLPHLLGPGSDSSVPPPAVTENGVPPPGQE